MTKTTLPFHNTTTKKRIMRTLFKVQSWLNFSLRSNDAKAVLKKKKKNGFLTENFYCKCFIIFYFFFAEDGP